MIQNNPRRKVCEVNSAKVYQWKSDSQTPYLKGPTINEQIFKQPCVHSLIIISIHTHFLHYLLMGQRSGD